MSYENSVEEIILLITAKIKCFEDIKLTRSLTPEEEKLYNRCVTSLTNLYNK